MNSPYKVNSRGKQSEFRLPQYGNLYCSTLYFNLLIDNTAQVVLAGNDSYSELFWPKCEGNSYVALVPGSHPAFRRLQYESNEKLDESPGLKLTVVHRGE